MEKLRLGGMALQNGVLVHGPTAWGAAVRLPDGTIKSASGPKPRLGARMTVPFVRGPLRLAEAFAVLPVVKRALPEARMPFERPAVAVALVAASTGASLARRSSLPTVPREATVLIASLAPALVALRGQDLTSYHGAEHVSIGTYETGERAAKEHERCGSHLVGPLTITTALAAAAAERAPARHRTTARLAGTVAALGAAVEIFGWMSRNPDRRLARALARPGTELQRRLSTSEPSDAQLEVAEAALRVCLEAEGGAVTAVTPRTGRERLDPEIFDLPVEKMRDGYYTDAYFNHTRAALLHDDRRPRVVMQLFQRKHAMVGGMDESIAILKLCSHDWDGLVVHALHDGDRIEPWETVMTVEGDYTSFAHLETVVLGTLARRTLIATNTARVLEAANGKPIIFMPARHDHHRVQTGDGYAAYIAGAVRGAEIGVTSDAQASWWGGQGLGTVPHALIAAYGGNTVLAATKFAEWAPDDLRITVLVDFENDSVRTALDVARALGPRLWGVRLDTSSQLVDRSLWDELGDFDPRGVNERLVRKVRAALDEDGFERVRIVASGGFTVEKIEQFERSGVPIDAYGVGSSLIRGENDFTADIVLTDGRPAGKVGRRYRPSERLELVR